MNALTYGISTWNREDESAESAVLTLYDETGANAYDLFISRFNGDWCGLSRERNTFIDAAMVTDLSYGDVKRALIEATVNYLEENR